MVAENVVLDNRRDRRFDQNWMRWVAGLVLTVGSLCWALFRMDLSREPVLPDRPLTKADVPLLEKKIKFLKMDADMTARFYPHLRNKAEIQEAQQAWEEVYYTPEVFPAAEKLHQLQSTRLLELQPSLAEHLRARQEYEAGRYDIANNPAITDKAAAIVALKNRLGSALKDPEYSRNAKQAVDILSGLVGDPELDNAEKDYGQACETAILKRHPGLAAYYHDLDFRNEAYHHFMAQANSLSRQMKALQSGGTQTVAAVATKQVVQPAVAATADGTGSQVNALTNGHAAAAALSGPAGRYGVKVGDTVEISALNPVVAARHALITTMDGEQLTVRVGSDTFNIPWENLIRLKAASKM